MVQLTDYLKLSNAAHIFYLFEDRNLYLDNLIAYVKGGMERDHHLLIIENSDIYQEAAQRIESLFSSEQKKRIHYINNYLFYRQYGVFHTHKIIEHFGELINSFLNEKNSIRSWAHVEWNEQDDIIRILKEYEDLADCCVNDFGLMSVCAYNSSDLSASLQTNMMRSHKYLMTDTEFVKSPLYKNI